MFSKIVLGMFSKVLDPSALILASGKLKQIKRSGWIKKAGIPGAESVADHSFRMAVLGMLLGEEAGLNTLKVVRMCLLHDLAESAIGDKMPEEKESESKHRANELKVLNEIFRNLPNGLRRKLTRDAKELMENITSESKLVWEIDKLEMGLQRLDYLDLGYSKEKLSHFNPQKLLSKQSEKILKLYETSRIRREFPQTL
ncbi:MAG TPA: HD domain-containing protein [Nitrososphaerales archaeon]|nr:HD domain-containing protein [Nitrososphaerales archaeon]